MAFDRADPAGEASVADTPEAAYNLEFGRTYVAAEEVRGFVSLNEAQQGVLAAWAACLIPAEAPWPSAAEVDAHMYADVCASRSPLLRSMLLRAVDGVEAAARSAHGRGFAECGAEVREALLRELSSGEDRVFFDLVLELVFEGYYRAPEVLTVVQERTGFQVMAPVEGAELIPFDEQLLERVRGLPPFFREVAL
jgi:Gluconate 2-dehydrogenase subunit 3